MFGIKSEYIHTILITSSIQFRFLQYVFYYISRGHILLGLHYDLEYCYHMIAASEVFAYIAHIRRCNYHQGTYSMVYPQKIVAYIKVGNRT